MVAVLVSLDGGTTINTTFNEEYLHIYDPFYYDTSSGAILLVAASFFALMISIPGLSWHIKNRNLPASSMVGWIVLLNLMNIINALLWPNDDLQKWWDGQIYCDTEIKLEIAATLGLVGSLACIMRSLARALDTNNIRLMASRGQRIRQNILELSLCVGFPLLLAMLHFVLQPLRYYIFAIAGCKASYSNSWSTIFLGYMWPPVFCLLNGYYAFLLTVRVYKYRRDFSSILSNSSSGMNKSRFLRLFFSAMTVLLVVIPTQAYALFVNVAYGMADEWTPTTWQTIVYVPTYGNVFPDRWVRLGIAVPVFLCFGWGRDANSIYRSWLRLLGLTRLFPVLAQPDSENPSYVGSDRGRGNHSNSSSSTVLDKAKAFFSFRDKRTNLSNSTSSSRSSCPHCGRCSARHDIERQGCGVELNMFKGSMAESIKTASVNAHLEQPQKNNVLHIKEGQ